MIAQSGLAMITMMFSAMPTTVTSTSTSTPVFFYNP